MLYICPPLIISKKELNDYLNIIEKGILNIEQNFLMEAIIVASGIGKRLGAMGKKSQNACFI